MSDLSKEIATYERLKDELETQHRGEWVLIKGEDQVGLYSNFEVAAADAVKKFGSGPYLIREIGAPPLTLSASVMYHL
jgi:hypothetical protein